jgi:hypothetical protein
MTVAVTAAATNPPPAINNDCVDSADDLDSTSTLGSIAHTLDLPS